MGQTVIPFPLRHSASPLGNLEVKQKHVLHNPFCKIGPEANPHYILTLS